MPLNFTPEPNSSLSRGGNWHRSGHMLNTKFTPTSEEDLRAVFRETADISYSVVLKALIASFDSGHFSISNSFVMLWVGGSPGNTSLCFKAFLGISLCLSQSLGRNDIKISREVV